jgi:hypothetical protein
LIVRLDQLGKRLECRFRCDCPGVADFQATLNRPLRTTSGNRKRLYSSPLGVNTEVLRQGWLLRRSVVVEEGRTWRKDSDQLPRVPIGSWRRINWIRVQTHYNCPIILLYKAGPDSPCVTLAGVLTCRAEDGGRICKRLSKASSQALVCIDRTKYSSLCLTRVLQSCIEGDWIKASCNTSPRTEPRFDLLVRLVSISIIAAL